jgi:hypothetical protein
VNFGFFHLKEMIFSACFLDEQVARLQGNDPDLDSNVKTELRPILGWALLRLCLAKTDFDARPGGLDYHRKTSYSSSDTNDVEWAYDHGVNATKNTYIRSQNKCLAQLHLRIAELRLIYQQYDHNIIGANLSLATWYAAPDMSTLDVHKFVHHKDVANWPAVQLPPVTNEIITQGRGQYHNNWEEKFARVRDLVTARYGDEISLDEYMEPFRSNTKHG